LVASSDSGNAEIQTVLKVKPEQVEVSEASPTVKSLPVPVAEFGAFVSQFHANNNEKFSSHFKASSFTNLCTCMNTFISVLHVISTGSLHRRGWPLHSLL